MSYDIIADTYQCGWRYARTRVCGSRSERRRPEPHFWARAFPPVENHWVTDCDGTCGHPLCESWHRGYADALNT